MISTSPHTSRSVYNLEKLLKPASYYAEIRPLNYTQEEEARKAKEAAKAAKAAALPQLLPLLLHNMHVIARST